MTLWGSQAAPVNHTTRWDNRSSTNNELLFTKWNSYASFKQIGWACRVKRLRRYKNRDIEDRQGRSCQKLEAVLKILRLTMWYGTLCGCPEIDRLLNMLRIGWDSAVGHGIIWIKRMNWVTFIQCDGNSEHETNVKDNWYVCRKWSRHCRHAVILMSPSVAITSARLSWSSSCGLFAELVPLGDPQRPSWPSSY